MGDKSTMISYSTTSKLLALCFLLILNTVAVDFELTDSALAQDAPVDFSSSVSDDAFGSIGNQPVIKTEVGLQKLPDMLMETSKSLLLTDGEEANCANPSPAHKTSRRSSRRIRKRLRQDFCSPQDHEKLRPARPSKPETNGTPAGQGGKAGVERPQGSIGGSNEFIHDPILNLEETRLFGEPNQALCPDMDKKVPVCTPYDQELRSPASVLVPSRFWRPDDWCSEMEGVWEDMWCCNFAYIRRSVAWESAVVFKRYPSIGIFCKLARNHYTDN